LLVEATTVEAKTVVEAELVPREAAEEGAALIPKEVAVVGET
jgi:hypothetical protein